MEVKVNNVIVISVINRVVKSNTAILAILYAANKIKATTPAKIPVKAFFTIGWSSIFFIKVAIVIIINIEGTGSGVIYKLTSDSAYIVTNNHVVEGGTKVEIETTSGYRVTGTVVGKDAVTDLAVVKIPKGLIDDYIEFSDSSALKVGEYVIAIGNPLGLSSSATLGILSSKERLVPVDTDGDGQDDFYAAVLQTDAAINPGNSGGALINLDGKLIGINSMKIAETYVEGIGFSIPSTLVMRIISELEANGEVNRPTRLLGITIQLTEYNNFFANKIVDVNNDSWAEQIGLQVDDLIIQINGNSIVNIFDLKYSLTNTPSGETLTLTIVRGNDTIEKEITMPAD